MTHQTLTDDQRDVTSLYALDALDDSERQAFETHLGDGCQVCRAEVDALQAVAGDLALTAPVRPVPPTVRARVLATANSETAGSLAIIRSHEGTWTELAPGFFRKFLSPRVGASVSLIRMEPGARVPRHLHTHVEHCYVVEGDVFVADEHLGPGDHHIAAKGTIHNGLTTEHGCLLLIAESSV